MRGVPFTLSFMTILNCHKSVQDGCRQCSPVSETHVCRVLEFWELCGGNWSQVCCFSTTTHRACCHGCGFKEINHPSYGPDLLPQWLLSVSNLKKDFVESVFPTTNSWRRKLPHIFRINKKIFFRRYWIVETYLKNQEFGKSMESSSLVHIED